MRREEGPSGTWGCSVLLFIQTDPGSAKCNPSSSVMTVWTVTWIEGYLYQFVHLISFFAVFNKMWTLSLFKTFGSNRLRQRIIKIYDSHSDSHQTVSAIATLWLHHPIPSLTDTHFTFSPASDLMSISTTVKTLLLLQITAVWCMLPRPPHPQLYPVPTNLAFQRLWMLKS